VQRLLGLMAGGGEIDEEVARSAIGHCSLQAQNEVYTYRFPGQRATFVLLHGTKPHARLIFIARGVKVERVEEWIW
jgi:hypothetical protein